MRSRGGGNSKPYRACSRLVPAGAHADLDAPAGDVVGGHRELRQHARGGGTSPARRACRGAARRDDRREARRACPRRRASRAAGARARRCSGRSGTAPRCRAPRRRRASAVQSSQVTSSWPSIIRQTRMRLTLAGKLRRRGGGTPRSTTSIRVRSRTPTATASATCEGIRRRLAYLAWLGVDAVWLSPIYRSPMADFGYDVSDHCDVEPLFGTLADFDRLAAEAHSVRPEADPRLRPEPHVRRAPVVPGRPRRRRAPRLVPVARRLDGVAAQQLAGRFGGPAWTWDDQAAAWYYHAYLPSSRTSTGAIRRSARRWARSCASGSSAAWTASASTRCARR